MTFFYLSLVVATLLVMYLPNEKKADDTDELVCDYCGEMIKDGDKYVKIQGQSVVGTTGYYYFVHDNKECYLKRMDGKKKR